MLAAALLRFRRYARVGSALLLGCESRHAPSPADSTVVAVPSAAEPSQRPALLGNYRASAVLALNEAGEKVLGAKRGAVFKPTGEGGELLFGQLTFTFVDDRVSVGTHLIMHVVDAAQKEAAEADKLVNYAWCQSSGLVRWQGRTLVVPVDIGSAGDSGTVIGRGKGVLNVGTDCSASLKAGEWQVKELGAETLLASEKDGIAVSLVPSDGGDVDLPSMARAWVKTGKLPE